MNIFLMVIGLVIFMQGLIGHIDNVHMQANSDLIKWVVNLQKVDEGTLKIVNEITKTGKEIVKDYVVFRNNLFYMDEQRSKEIHKLIASGMTYEQAFNKVMETYGVTLSREDSK